MFVASFDLTCLAGLGDSRIVHPSLIEFRKDFFVHLAVEQVGEDFVVHPCDESLLFFFAQSLFGEERIDIRFASGHILFAGFDTGFHVRETFGAFLGGLFVGFVVRLSLRHGQLR